VVATVPPLRAVAFFRFEPSEIPIEIICLRNAIKKGTTNTTGTMFCLPRLQTSMRRSIVGGLHNQIDRLLAIHPTSYQKNYTSMQHDSNIEHFTDNMNTETRSLADQLLVELDYEVSPSSSWWQHRLALAQAITLVESRGQDKEMQASALLTFLLQKSQPQNSFRIGLAGSPGAGKSSFIEALGKYILERPREDQVSLREDQVSLRTHGTTTSTVWNPQKLAIVCIDPSSLRTGGSILGDKTRMTALSADPRAFIRPSAAKGTLGGLAPRTDDVLRLLSQQYPLTILETVGLGQSEVEVQQSVDMLILAIPPGGGDDLQGVKKGIVEVADLIVVTKADGNFLAAAKRTAGDYRGAMQFLHSVTAHLDSRDLSDSTPTPVLLTSAAEATGLKEVWEHIGKFRQAQIKSGQLQKRRQQQGRYWMWKHLQSAVHDYTETDINLQKLANELHKQLDNENIPPRVAASILFDKLKSR
jgi:LAO/AO transport system kinase